jgi:hypothetical protein
MSLPTSISVTPAHFCSVVAIGIAFSMPSRASLTVRGA